jgi:hypothetical protein|tara:strand:- start:4446 stop:4598 length:153 start_codon:yes stop_codon:yes gene_type:complete
MNETLELLAFSGTIVGILITFIKYESRRLCKDIDEVKSDIKEIHKEVFHK